MQVAFQEPRLLRLAPEVRVREAQSLAMLQFKNEMESAANSSDGARDGGD